MKKILAFTLLVILMINCKRNVNEINPANQLGKNSEIKLEKDTLKNEVIINEEECYSKTKITNLPITTSVIDGNDVWNQLDCNISDLTTRDYLRLPDINDVKVFIIGDFNFDDFRYTLITLKNNKVITKQDIGFAKEGDKPNTISEFTQFEVDKDYIFNLNTKSKTENDFKIIKTERFRIDDNGLIVTIE